MQGNGKGDLFQTTGGVTPQQAALSQYDYGQNLLEGQAQFEGSGQGGGPIMSTMATQTAGGAKMGEALQNIGMSQTDADAELKAFNVAQGATQQAQANTNTELSELGKLAGTAAAGT